MTTNNGALALLLAPLTLILGTAAMADKNTDDLSCEIRSSGGSGGVRLEAVATAGVPLSGEYEFAIAKAGAGGSSNVTQGGEFEVTPGEATLLGEVTLGSGEDASVQAVLTVSTADGRSCESRFPRPL